MQDRAHHRYGAQVSHTGIQKQQSPMWAAFWVLEPQQNLGAIRLFLGWWRQLTPHQLRRLFNHNAHREGVQNWCPYIWRMDLKVNRFCLLLLVASSLHPHDLGLQSSILADLVHCSHTPPLPQHAEKCCF